MYIDRTLVAVNGAGAEVVTGNALTLWDKKSRTFTFQTVYNEAGVDGEGGADLVGTIAVEGSLDPRSDPSSGDHANADWKALSNLTMGESEPDGGLGGDIINVSFIGLVAVRLVLTGSAGTGSFKAYFVEVG